MIFLVIIITFPQKFTEILDCGSQYIFELASFLPSHLTPVSYFLFCRLEITAQPALWGSYRPPRLTQSLYLWTALYWANLLCHFCSDFIENK